MEIPAFVAQKHSTVKVKHISQNKQSNQNKKTACNLSGIPSKVPPTSSPQFTPDKQSTIRARKHLLLLLTSVNRQSCLPPQKEIK
eukprot:1067449-Ditylum_brightwellii.AAC.1